MCMRTLVQIAAAQLKLATGGISGIKDAVCGSRLANFAFAVVQLHCLHVCYLTTLSFAAVHAAGANGTGLNGELQAAAGLAVDDNAGEGAALAGNGAPAREGAASPKHEPAGGEDAVTVQPVAAAAVQCLGHDISVCEVCGSADFVKDSRTDPRVMLLCHGAHEDGCECQNGAHLGCLGLPHVPPGRWFCKGCSTCEASGSSCGQPVDRRRSLLLVPCSEFLHALYRMAVALQHCFAMSWALVWGVALPVGQALYAMPSSPPARALQQLDAGVEFVEFHAAARISTPVLLAQVCGQGPEEGDMKRCARCQQLSHVPGCQKGQASKSTWRCDMCSVDKPFRL